MHKARSKENGARTRRSDAIAPLQCQNTTVSNIVPILVLLLQRIGDLIV
jgi:hypothetical protein